MSTQGQFTEQQPLSAYAVPAELPDEPARKRGCSSPLMIVLAIIGISAILCCCSCGGIYGWFGWSLISSIKTEPADIQTVQDEIGKITLPDGFHPVGAMDMVMLGYPVVKAVVYVNAETSAAEKLEAPASAPGTTDTTSESASSSAQKTEEKWEKNSDMVLLGVLYLELNETQRNEVIHEIKSNYGQNTTDMTIHEAHTVEIEVMGKNYPFNVVTLKNAASEKASLIQVQGMVKTASDKPALFLFMGSIDKWSEENIIGMARSMNLK